MPLSEDRRQRFVRLRARGWLGFLSALATIAAVGVALFFWANGSAIGAVIAVVAAIAFVAITAMIIAMNKNDSPDPALGSRMARLRRSRYRDAYPRSETRQDN